MKKYFKNIKFDESSARTQTNLNKTLLNSKMQKRFNYTLLPLPRFNRPTAFCKLINHVLLFVSL